MRSIKHLSFGALLMLANHSVSMIADVSKIIVKEARQSVLPPVSRQVFDSLRINVGTVVKADENKKVRIPSYILKLDFQKPHFKHLLQSSAQLVDRYVPQNDEADRKALMGMQLVAVTNFPARSVGVKSFFLTLGVVGLSVEDNGTVVLTPAERVPNGSRITVLNDVSRLDDNVEAGMALVEFTESFEHIDFRVGTVTDVALKTVDFGELGTITLEHDDYALRTGLQVIRIFNLSGDDANKDNLLGIVDETGRKIPVTVASEVKNGRFVL